MDTAIDHLVYGVANLDDGVEALGRRLGVRAAFGGKHQGRGTHNALVALGETSYLELIAPDPDQTPPPGPLPFGVRADMHPHLVGWAMRSDGIDTAAIHARTAGYDPGQVQPMHRRAPDGTRLHWRLTGPAATPSSFLVPFLIDWADTPHPAASAPAGLRLLDLRAEHPHPATITAHLQALHAQLPVGDGPEPALIAILHTPNGQIELR